MAAEAEAVAAGESDRRLSADVADPAMRRLAETVNAAFDAQQQAEAHLRAFVADASHELRTPLTVTAGWIELYLQGGLEEPEQRDEAMRRASRQLDRMRTLVDDLALLARLDEHRPLEHTQVDLARVARETVEDARIIDPERRIALVARGPAMVRGDEERLYQVVRNLVGNALSHTPTASDVTIEVVASVGGAPHLLRVSDRGPGMPPEQVPHAFDRFWRGDASRSRQTGGSGLGLSIAHSIVEAHDGELRLVSSPNAGTVVEVVLPAA
jgi:two-component system OmpR family sensor kinase